MTALATGSDRRGGFVAAVVAAVVGLLISVVGVPPSASATAVGISGTQHGISTVYWSTARANTYLKNAMAISPYNGTNLGVPSLTTGARSTSAAGASFAKTTALYAGGSGSFTMVSTGSFLIPAGTFYLTTSLGPAACGCDEALIWTATLKYDINGGGG